MMNNNISSFYSVVDRAILRLDGPDASSFLQDLISLDINEVTHDQAGFAALLTPQGKILFDFFLVQTEDGFLIDCDKVHAAALLKRLKMYKLRAAITLNNVSEDYVIFAAITKDEFVDSDMVIFKDPRHPQMGYRLFLPSSLYDSSNSHKIFKNIPEEKIETYREHALHLSITSIGEGLNPEQAFLLDVNYDALGAVSYKKGCFIGQEVSSRMKRKGQIRRRTLTISGPGITELDTNPGDDHVLNPIKIMAGDTSLGSLLAKEGDIGAALIRMDHFSNADPSQITLNGHSVTITIPEYLENSDK